MPTDPYVMRTDCPPADVMLAIAKKMHKELEDLPLQAHATVLSVLNQFAEFRQQQIKMLEQSREAERARDIQQRQIDAIEKRAELEKAERLRRESGTVLAGILLAFAMLFGASSALAQDKPAAPPPAPEATPAFTQTEQIAIGAITNEMTDVQNKLFGMQRDIQAEHPGWTMDTRSFQIVKIPAAPTPPASTPAAKVDEKKK